MIILRPKSYDMKKKWFRETKPKVIFRHGHIAITDYRSKEHKHFEYELSIWDPISFKSTMIGGYYIPELLEFRINRGCNVQFLKRHFPNHEFCVDNQSFQYDKIDIKLLAAPRDDFQKTALTFMACEGHYKQYANYTQQLIDADVGDGKTYCGTAASAIWTAKSVVFVPIGRLLGQWRDSFLTFTNLEEEDVMIVKGSSKCEEIRLGQHLDKKVFIFSIDTFDSYLKQVGPLRTEEMLSMTHAYHKIVDEVHRDMGILRKLEALSNFRMNYYMSASPGRSDSKEDKIFLKLFTNTPRFGSNFKNESEKHINFVVKKYEFIPTMYQEREMYRPKIGLNTKQYERVLLEATKEQRESFDQSILTMLNWSKKMIKPKNKILILTNTIAGTEYVKQLAEQVFPGECASYYSSMKPKEKEAALKKRIISATEGSLGTGADIKGIQHVYNILTYSNKIGAKQYPGRGRKIDDKTPIVYVEFVNMEYRRTYLQFQKRRPYLRKYAKGNKIIIIS